MPVASRALCQWLITVSLWVSMENDQTHWNGSTLILTRGGSSKAESEGISMVMTSNPRYLMYQAGLYYTQLFKAIYLHNVFGFNITPEAIVGPITKLGGRWVVKNINLTVLYLKKSKTRLLVGIHSFHELFLPASLADLLNPMIDRNFDLHFCSFYNIYSKTASSTIKL